LYVGILNYYIDQPRNNLSLHNEFTSSIFMFDGYEIKTSVSGLKHEQSSTANLLSVRCVKSQNVHSNFQCNQLCLEEKSGRLILAHRIENSYISSSRHYVYALGFDRNLCIHFTAEDLCLL